MSLAYSYSSPLKVFVHFLDSQINEGKKQCNLYSLTVISWLLMTTPLGTHPIKHQPLKACFTQNMEEGSSFVFMNATGLPAPRAGSHFLDSWLETKGSRADNPSCSCKSSGYYLAQEAAEASRLLVNRTKTKIRATSFSSVTNCYLQTTTLAAIAIEQAALQSGKCNSS